MENQTPNQMPPHMPPQTPVNAAPSTPENKSSIGGVIATILILALILLGALYFWGKRMEQNQAAQALRDQDNATQTATVVNSTTSSDDLNSIGADLKAVDTTNLGSELH